MKPVSQPLNILFLLASIGAIVSCLGALGHLHYWFDLVSNFAVQALLGLVPVLLLACFRKRLAYAVLFSVVCAFHVYNILPAWWPSAQHSNNEPANHSTFKIVNSNLWVANRDHERYLNFLNAQNADVVVFQEYTELWSNYFNAQLTDYPYRVEETKNSAFGIAIWSKHPIVNHQVIDFVSKKIPSIHADININGQALTLLGTHPIAPVSKKLFNNRNKQLELMAEWATTIDSPLLIAGDFNITPWSVFFKKMVRKGKLLNAGDGHGLNPTWPAQVFPLLIPIDHMFVNQHLKVISFNASGDVGSDHRSIVATIALE